MINSNDITTRAIEWAMDGLERRSQVIADNVANAEVPNFTGREVSFESQLRSAIDAPRLPESVEPLVSRSNAPEGPNGNNVRLEDELVEMIETNLMKSAMVQAFNYKATLLRTAMRGS